MRNGSLTLTLRAEPPQRVDMTPLVPARLAGLTPDAVGALPLVCGTRRVRVGDLFEVAPADAPGLTVAGPGGGRLDRVGAGMAEGAITVAGDAGAYLGLAMAGGTLRVSGGAGTGAAMGMTGGEIEIGGDAGERLGGSLPGAMTGMAGGTVIVRGDAGARAGDRMRRGTILVEGSLGDYPGSRMIAGTLVGLGPRVGDWPGFGMRRGTLLLTAAPERLLPTFADAGAHDLGFLRLLLRAHAGRSPRLAALGLDAVRVRRLVGDLVSAGQGEILLWPTPAPG